MNKFLINLFSLKPINLPEKITFWSIVLILPTWIIGGTYVVGSVLGWVYLFLLIKDRGISNILSLTFTKKLLLLSWVISSLLLLIALVIGHIDFGYSTSAILKSSIGWAKGWASFPLYIIAGLLPIRKAILVRAVIINCIGILCIAPLFFLWGLIGLPSDLYTSPLKIVSPGLGKVFFDVTFYVIDPSTGALKFRIFTPWSPALGLVANIYLWIIVNEEVKFFRLLGVTSVIMMCLMAGSRAAIIGTLIIPCIVYSIARIRIYYLFGSLAVGVNLLTIFFDPIFEFLDAKWQALRSMRADSSRVRAVLSEIGINGWYEESFWWGHGTVERGPKLVEFMPIGSHNSWIALLYIKGLVGFFAFLMPMIFSLIYFFAAMMKSKKQSAISALAIVLILFQYTISENLEMLIYLYWPGVIFLGLTLADDDSTDYLPSNSLKNC